MRVLPGLFVFFLTAFSVFGQIEAWRLGQSRSIDHLYAITYGRGVYVAVGNHRTILTSHDGVRWQVRGYNRGVPGWLSRVAYGKGTFVAVGSGRQPDNPLSSQYKGPPGSDGYTIGDNHYPIVVSRNGTHWQRLRRGERSLTAVTYGGGLFIAIGRDGLLTSRNGYTWIRPDKFYDPSGTPQHVAGLPPDFQEVAYGNGRFVVLGFRGNLVVSTNGTDWVNYSKYGGRGFGDLYATALLFDDSRFVGAGWAQTADTIFSSGDGIHWSGIARPGFAVTGLDRGIDRIVAVGEAPNQGGRIQSSQDGLDWSHAPIEIAGAPYAVSWGRRGFVVVGFDGLILHSPLAHKTHRDRWDLD